MLKDTALDLLDDLRDGSIEDRAFAVFFILVQVFCVAAVVFFTLGLFGVIDLGESNCQTTLVGKSVIVICDSK